MSVHNCY